MADYPIGTFKIGYLIADIEAYLQGRFTINEIEEKFPRKLIFNEINRQTMEMHSLNGVRNDTDYSYKFSIDTNNDEINIHNLEHEKIDRIISVTYGVGALCVEKDERSFYEIKSKGSSSNYTNEVIWYRNGTTIYFHKGTGISDYGVRTIWFRRLPELCTTYEDKIDIKDTDINSLKSYVINTLLSYGSPRERNKGSDEGLEMNKERFKQQSDISERQKNKTAS